MNAKRVILIHGKDKSSKDVWYPWLKAKLTERGLICEIPDMPQASDPKIKEWIAVIESLHPDENTILVGHSRGGMAILRWLEIANRRVEKVVLVGTNSATIEDSANSDFYSGPFDFETIRNNCNNFVVVHSKDDQWVPYEAALENAAGLHAQLITFENNNHFGKNAEGILMLEFPELLDVITNTVKTQKT